MEYRTSLNVSREDPTENSSCTLNSLRPRRFQSLYMYSHTYILVLTVFHVEHFSLLAADP
jgi:hypothetical protein